MKTIKDKSLVIIPTYNEIENIDAIIAAVLRQGSHFYVLIVDDGSPDGTADRVKSLQKKHGERIHLLEREGKLGLGTAYIAGFKYALSHDFTYILEMDADFSHNPDDLPRLLSAVAEGGADIAVGSRYTKDGGVKDWPLDRIILSYGASIYVRMITWMNVKDPTAGFVCYHRKVLEALDLDKIKFVGYAFQIEMKYYSQMMGFIIKEVPITFKDRLKGNSKMNKTIISEAIKGVLSMRWKAIRGYYS